MDLDHTFKARLLRLADFLDTLEPARFDFNRWVGLSWGGKEDLSCGTTACGLGWATTIPEFRELGLRMLRKAPEHAGSPFHVNYGFVGLAESKVTGDEENPSWLHVLEATQKVFGLDEEQTTHLFTPCDLEVCGCGESCGFCAREEDERQDRNDHRLPEDAHPKMLARHIRAFVNGEHDSYF